MRSTPNARRNRGRRAALSCALLALTSLSLSSGNLLAQRRPQPVVAIEVGTVHPVSGPAVQDAVILIQGGRIQAVGAKSEIEIPADAQRMSFPAGHAYPGLVDALSTAYCDPDLLGDGSLDAGTSVEEGLDPFDVRSRDLVKHGITTAYVSNRSNSTWRGQGALVRLRDGGPGQFRSAPDAAVHARMTAGPGPSHALSRAKQLGSIGKIFDGLEKYEETREEYSEKLAEYEKEWKKYLDHFEKKNGKKDTKDDKSGEKGDKAGAESGDDPKKKPEAAGDKKDEKGEAPKEGETPRRGPRRGGRRPNSTPAETEKAKPDEGSKPADGAAKESDDKAPKRPTYPKEPEEDPVKDALIGVRDGARVLRVEAHRVDEIRAALDLKKERSIPSMILEGGTAAGSVAKDLAAAGVGVVLTDVEVFGASPYLNEGEDILLAALAEAGVQVAIGSGDIRRAPHLPLLAARAAALGLGEEAAVRAVTLTPAEFLGVADRVGSLEAGKVADLLITSAPLLSSDARVLTVLSGGRPVAGAGPQDAGEGR